MNDLEIFEQQLKSIKVPERYLTGKDYEYRYWFRALLQRATSCVEFTGLPETWPKNFFATCLFCLGHLVVFDSKRFGVSFQPCSFAGPLDFYYQPTEAIVSNPKLTKNFKLGEEAELIKLCGDYKGILDLIDYYATKLANLSIAINMQFGNAKLPALFSARNEAEKRLIETAYDDVQSGKPIIITRQTSDSDEIIPAKEVLGVWNQDFKQTYIGCTLLEDLQTVLDLFYAEIGISTTVDKASHILTQEAAFQDHQAQSRIRDWKKYLDESLKKVNEHFGLNVEVRYACEDDTSGDREISEQSE